MHSVSSLYWGLPIILFSFFALDLIITKILIRKHYEHPLVGSPSALTPRVVLNLIFAGKAADILENGYRKVTAELQLDIRFMLTSAKFKNGAFQLVRGDGIIVILPKSLLDELSTLPATIASPNGALEHDLLGPYTGLDLILESRLHHSIVQRKLTPRLGVLTPRLENELKAAFEDYFPTCDEWTEFTPYQLFAKISARLSGRALVGATLCRNPTWLDISFNYTENRASSSKSLRLKLVACANRHGQYSEPSLFYACSRIVSALYSAVYFLPTGVAKDTFGQRKHSSVHGSMSFFAKAMMAHGVLKTMKTILMFSPGLLTPRRAETVTQTP